MVAQDANRQTPGQKDDFHRAPLDHDEVLTLGRCKSIEEELIVS
jgi:hypothetical protein